MYVLCGPTSLEMPQKLFLFLKVEVIQFCQPSNAKNVHKSGINSTLIWYINIERFFICSMA